MSQSTEDGMYRKVKVDQMGMNQQRQCEIRMSRMYGTRMGLVVNDSTRPTSKINASSKISVQWHQHRESFLPF